MPVPIPLPFSPAYALLVLALPAITLLAREVTRDLTRDLGLRAVVPAGVALALWLLAVHLASLLARSLRVGLPIGTLALALTGVLAEIERRRDPDRPAPTGRRPSPWMWITAIATTAAIAPMAFKFHFHDELLVTGHMSIAAEMQNGIYPPRHLGFPDTPLRYHYCFDLLTACLTALLRLQIDTAIDVATVLLWATSWCLLWVLGERLVGRRRAWLTPFVTLFAGGIPVGCPPAGPSVIPNVIGECRMGFHGRWSMNAPVVSYFFQHPWGLGIPLAITAVLVFTERSPRSPRARYALLAALFAALSLGEVALFVTLLPSTMAAEAFHEGRLEPRRLRAMLGVGAVALGAAKLLGGFFVTTRGLAPVGLTLHAGFTDTWRETVVWNLKNLGVFWLLGPLGLAVRGRGRILFGLLAVGSILVVNGVRYAASGDIMKFATVALLALAILGSVALARAFPARPGDRPARTTLAAVLLLAATGAGALYVLAFTLDLADVSSAWRVEPDALGQDDVDAMVFLRRRVAPGDLVYRRAGKSPGYAQWAGLPQPWTHWTTAAFGFPATRIAARDRLLATKPPELDQYRAQGFRFLVLERASNDDKSLLEHADKWLQAGGATVAARFGGLVVIEVTPPR